MGKKRHLINGVLKNRIDVTDRGFQFGDGLFETMLLLDGQVPLIEAHMKRLAIGCQRLQIHCPDKNLIRDEILQLGHEARNRSIIKLIVTRGSGGSGYNPPQKQKSRRILVLKKYPENYQKLKKTGIKLHFCKHRLSRNRDLAGIKHLNRLEQVLASSESLGSDYHEGLMLDTQDNVIEGTRMNMFLIDSGNLVTPALSHSGVAGVFRDEVIMQAINLGINVDIRTIDKTKVLKADGVFMTNAIAGILPVAEIEGTLWQTHSMIPMLNQNLPF